jgi:hypothetical protein
VSLARSSMWVRSQPTLPEGFEHLGRPYEDPVSPDTITRPSPFGRVTALGPVIEYSATPGSWERPPEPLGASSPEWQPR